jgi:hypothetical protein
MTADKSFPLTYCHQVAPPTVRINYEFRAVQCVMLRHRPDKWIGETTDSFTVHLAADMRWLGEGDTKDDAMGEAQYNLMRESQSAYQAAQSAQSAGTA